MAELSMKWLLAGSKQQRKREDESPEKYVARLTHITVVGRDIKALAPCLELCGAATTLYLYENAIERMEHLSMCRSLTTLFLQRNNITRIEGLEALPALTRLNLGHNRIALVEGLEAQRHLQELHLEQQSLPAGEKLLFDPRSMRAIQSTLGSLNLAGNQLDTLFDLRDCHSLHTLNLSHNSLVSIEEVLFLVGDNMNLHTLLVADNPLCRVAKYQDDIIGASMSLTKLDTREVTPVQREFLAQWQQQKFLKQRKVQQQEQQQQQQPQKVALAASMAASVAAIAAANPTGPFSAAYDSFAKTQPKHTDSRNGVGKK